jgi:protein O-GlcNAc transferase
MNSNLAQKFASAIQLFQAGNVQEADRLASEILSIDPKSSDALQLRGVIAGLQNRHVEAEIFLKSAADITRNNQYIFFNLAKSLSEQGKYAESLGWLKKALALDPKQDKTWLNYGECLFKLGEVDAALHAFDRALKINGDLAEAYSNQANCYNEKRIYEKSLALHDQAIKLKPSLAQAWNNRGITLNGLRRHAEALASYERAIELRPDYAEAWNNHGITLIGLRRHEEALASYERAIELRPDYAEAWNNQGLALNDLRRYEDALTSYGQAVKLNPSGDFFLGNLLHTKMKICDWVHLDQYCDTLRKKILAWDRVSTPFEVLAIFDSPPLLKRCAEIYASERLSQKSQLGAIARRATRHKIRIGYFSMDFGDHPVSHLIVESLELHDREKFEIYGFSFGVSVRDPTRERIRKAFDKFFDVENYCEVDIARLARQVGIDIAIDLGGYTQNARPQIFAERAAPIQINYLGYPGTMGSKHFDYVIADQILVPKENRDAYSEKIIYLPNSYQANASSQKISDRQFTRNDVGLDTSKFVFCSFNNTWKITPQTFSLWMQILRSVDSSILWLLIDSPVAVKNLRKEALARDINPERLIFADRIPRAEHLSRFRLADLFLDTFPYNAHTTSSDSLGAGVPVLTLKGQTFAARVAASLLTNIGIPELVANTSNEYCSLAVELASNSNKLAKIKSKLIGNRDSTPLFDTHLFVRHLETAYQRTLDRSDADLSPEHIYINH